MFSRGKRTTIHGFRSTNEDLNLTTIDGVSLIGKDTAIVLEDYEVLTLQILYTPSSLNFGVDHIFFNTSNKRDVFADIRIHHFPNPLDVSKLERGETIILKRSESCDDSLRLSIEGLNTVNSVSIKDSLGKKMVPRVGLSAFDNIVLNLTSLENGNYKITYLGCSAGGTTILRIED